MSSAGKLMTLVNQGLTFVWSITVSARTKWRRRIGTSSPTGMPSRVTTKHSPRSSARMVSPLPLRSSRSVIRLAMTSVSHRCYTSMKPLSAISAGWPRLASMNNRLKGILIGGTAVAALAVGGVAIAGNDDDGSERAIGGKALDRASAAALEHTGGGRVTETEAGDEESYYEVEVTRGDGSQVDVHLDRDFQVVGSEGDDGEGDGPDDE